MPGEVLESHCLENARKVLSLYFSLSLSLSLTCARSVLVFVRKCFDGRGKTGAKGRKEKANLESEQEKNNLESLLADL